jgi:hypothetical protein
MILVGIFCVVFIARCGIFESPSSVVRKFCTAIEKNDAKAMEQVATPQTVLIITMFGEKLQGVMVTRGKIISTTEEINGDTAVVVVTFEDGTTENLDLIKVDGKWKVTFKK